MTKQPATGRHPTHDWASDHDPAHIERIRREPAVFAPGGASHLVLEVLAYAADEAAHTGSGHAIVTLHDDGSVSVTDNGRGTATHAGGQSQAVKKPVMTTKDLRFFDTPEAEALPDGHPRRGLSVVTALSTWLEHTNRRHDGAWTQRYENGTPATALTPIPADGTTGTTVRFLPDTDLVSSTEIPLTALRQLAPAFGPALTVKITAHRANVA